MKLLVVILTFLAIPFLFSISYLIFVGLTKLVFIALHFCGKDLNLNVWAVGFIGWIGYMFLKGIFKQDKK